MGSTWLEDALNDILGNLVGSFFIGEETFAEMCNQNGRPIDIESIAKQNGCVLLVNQVVGNPQKTGYWFKKEAI